MCACVYPTVFSAVGLELQILSFEEPHTVYMFLIKFKNSSKRSKLQKLLEFN